MHLVDKSLLYVNIMGEVLFKSLNCTMVCGGNKNAIDIGVYSNTQKLYTLFGYLLLPKKGV